MALLTRSLFRVRARAGVAAMTPLVAAAVAAPGLLAPQPAAASRTEGGSAVNAGPALENVCTGAASFVSIVGQGELCQQAGYWVMRLSDGRRIQVSAPDTAAALQQSSANPTGAPSSALSPPGSIVAGQCVTSATQPRIELYYAHFAGEPDNYGAMAADLRQQFLAVDDDYMNYDASTYFGVSLHLYVACDSSGQPIVRDIALSTSIGSSNFSTIVADMMNAGHCTASQGGTCSAPGPVHYWVYTDGNPAAALGYAGQSSITGDDSATPGNAINSSDQYSINYGYCLNGIAGAAACDAPVDTQSPGFGPQIFAHENGHALGAVQLSAPDSTGAWHCTDGLDVMCYNDGGPDAAAYNVSDCGSTGNGTVRFDCRLTDYFNPAPAPGSYLATHWDVAGAYDAWVSLTRTQTATALVASTLTPIAGQPFTVSATVTPVGGGGVPTGAVSFADGTASLGSAPLDGSGTASLTTSTLSTGAHAITASYAGSGNFAASDASALIVSVGATLPAGRYVPVAPFRVFDSRPASCVQCAGGAPLGPGASWNVQIAGDPTGNGTVPAGATAVVLNLTGTQASAPTFLQLFPTGSNGTGVTSSLNVEPYSLQANLVIVPLGPGGQVTMYNAAGWVHAILDVEGYFVSQTAPAPAGTAGTFHPLPPIRVCDTRGVSPTPCGTEGVSDPLGQGEARAITVWSAAAGGVPSDGTAAAVVFNLTATGDSVGTYLTAFPPDATTHACGAPPTASNLNVVGNGTMPNRVIVPVDPTTGQVCIYNDTGSVNVIVDVNGWFGDGAESATGALYYASMPSRACDTRAASPWNQCTGQQMSPSGVLGPVDLAGSAAGDPVAPVAVAANITATDATTGTFVAAYPAGSSWPSTSDLNVRPGVDIPNLSIVKLGGNSGVDVLNDFGNVDIVVDIEGWFA